MTLSAWAMKVKGAYLQAVWLDERIPNDQEAFEIAGLWLSEGVPHAMRDYPFAYQRARERLATQLGCETRNVSMTGSARLGFSTTATKFAQPFQRGKSDCDLFAVRNELFSNLMAEADRFVADYKTGAIKPGSEAQRRYWDDFVERLASRKKLGLIDAGFIPRKPRYATAAHIHTCCEAFTQELHMLAGDIIVRKSSLRVYKDWDSAVRQLAKTLQFNIQRRREQARITTGPHPSEQ